MKYQKAKNAVLVLHKSGDGFEGIVNVLMGDGMFAHINYRRYDSKTGGIMANLSATLAEGVPPVTNDTRLLTGVEFRTNGKTEAEVDEYVGAFLDDRLGIHLQLITVVHGLKNIKKGA